MKVTPVNLEWALVGMTVMLSNWWIRSSPWQITARLPKVGLFLIIRGLQNNSNGDIETWLLHSFRLSKHSVIDKNKGLV